jgi:hypothetical protein
MVAAYSDGGVQIIDLAHTSEAKFALGGTSPANTGFQLNGVDIASYYARVADGSSSGVDNGFKFAGNDIDNIIAQDGSLVQTDSTSMTTGVAGSWTGKVCLSNIQFGYWVGSPVQCETTAPSIGNTSVFGETLTTFMQISLSTFVSFSGNVPISHFTKVEFNGGTLLVSALTDAGTTTTSADGTRNYNSSTGTTIFRWASTAVGMSTGGISGTITFTD